MRKPRLTLVLLVATASLVMAAPPPVAAAETQLRFMEFNYCGAATHDDCLGSQAGEYDSTLADHVWTFSPHVLVINEICWSQFQALKVDLASRPQPWTFASSDWQWQEDKATCDGAYKGFGNAILTRNAFTQKQVEPLLPLSEGRTIMCVTTAFGSPSVPLAACVTKLSATGTISEDQVDPAMEFARDYAAGKALFVGGDFNLLVNNSEFDDIYASSGGNFQEMDQCQGSKPARSLAYPTVCNRNTHIKKDDHSVKNKLDYMFFKQAYAKWLTPLAPANVDSSDHHITWGYATICSPACGT
jgi:hypothetical protein